MRNIYFVRHALPNFPNRDKYCIGQTDFPLSDEGKIQAVLLRHAATELFANNAVFCSRLSRAKETAFILNSKARVVQGLEEMHAGLWDGLKISEIEKNWPEIFRKRDEKKNIPIPGAEDTQKGLCRFLAAVESCLEKSTGDIVVVAHSTVIQAFMAYSCSTPLDESRMYRLPYCSVSKVGFAGQYSTEYWGKTYVPDFSCELLAELTEQTSGDIPYLLSILRNIGYTAMAEQIEAIS